jgi:hypothetical protein
MHDKVYEDIAEDKIYITCNEKSNGLLGYKLLIL